MEMKGQIVNVLSDGVVEQDHRLEQRATKATEELAKLRWHWTLNEINAERVSLRAYAKAVGRDDRGIRAQAHGYAAWIADAGVLTLSECIERAKVGAETEAAIEAVSAIRGVTFKTAREAYAPEVKQVRRMAADMVADQGLTPEQARTEAKAQYERAHKAAKAVDRARQDARDLLRGDALEIDGYVQGAKRRLLSALDIARHSELPPEAVNHLSEALANLTALIHLVEAAVVGRTSTDWDAELARITEVA